MTKVRRQRELLSRLEDEMKLVRGRREEVISKKEEFSLFGSQLFISGLCIQVARKLDEEQMRTMEAEVRIQSKSDLILAPLYQEILSQGNISQYIHCGGGSVLENMISEDHIIHSFIIIREVLILTLSVFIAL